MGRHFLHERDTKGVIAVISLLSDVLVCIGGASNKWDVDDEGRIHSRVDSTYVLDFEVNATNTLLRIHSHMFTHARAHAHTTRATLTTRT